MGDSGKDDGALARCARAREEYADLQKRQTQDAIGRADFGPCGLLPPVTKLRLLVFFVMCCAANPNRRGRSAQSFFGMNSQPAPLSRVWTEERTRQGLMRPY